MWGIKPDVCSRIGSVRFLKGIHYPHRPRGAGRGQYYVSELARRARRQNLSRSRLRSDRESQVIKLLIWQSCFYGPRRSQRSLARQLGVCQSYVWKVQRQWALGVDGLSSTSLVTLEDMYAAKRFTAKMREQHPCLLARAKRSPHSDSSLVRKADPCLEN